jgi:quinol monooxygenase YgiN
VSWNLQLAVREGRLEALRSLMDEMVASTRSEPGTLAYEWFISADETVCHLYERYRDDAAALAHIGRFGAVFAERFFACVEQTGFHVYGGAGPDVRAALDGHGVVFLDRFGGFSR